jgi:hypothetical protein
MWILQSIAGLRRVAPKRGSGLVWLTRFQSFVSFDVVRKRIEIEILGRRNHGVTLEWWIISDRALAEFSCDRCFPRGTIIL